MLKANASGGLTVVGANPKANKAQDSIPSEGALVPLSPLLPCLVQLRNTFSLNLKL